MKNDKHEAKRVLQEHGGLLKPLSGEGLMVLAEPEQAWNRSRCISTSPANCAAWGFPPPLNIRCTLALLLLFVKTLGTNHADGCLAQTQPWLGMPRREGNPRKGRERAGIWGAGQHALCLLSKGYHQLNLATGF